MAEPNIQVHGLHELGQDSLKLSERIGKRASEEFNGIAHQVGGAVRSEVPRDTGALAAAYRIEETDTGWSVGIQDKGEVPYAGWIEFGGEREGGRNATAERDYIPEGRYLFPLAFSAEPVLIAEGSKATEDEIRGFPWKTPRA